VVLGNQLNLGNPAPQLDLGDPEILDTQWPHILVILEIQLILEILVVQQIPDAQWPHILEILVGHIDPGILVLQQIPDTQ